MASFSTEQKNSVDVLLNKPFTSLSMDEKIDIKKLGRPTPDLPGLKQTVKTEKRTFHRQFNKNAYVSNSWLCGCDKREAFFCFPCLLFGGEGTWTKTGYKDLNHLNLRAIRHSSSATHLKNSLQLSLLGEFNIEAQLDSAYRRKITEHNEQVQKNRYILNSIINCIRFCGAFELALGGYDESEESISPGIFRGLINLSSELDGELSKHIAKSTVFQGNSNTIQNELLDIMLAVCQENISKEIKAARFVSIIADETSDVSNTYQMAIIYRYVVNNKPVERFFQFLSPAHHNAKALATCILDQLKMHELDKNPSKLIAQTYDGASLMSGGSNGVQALVKAEYTEAQYIHCYAHQLNLVMMKAASINRAVKVFFATLQGICSFFSNNPQRTRVLDEIAQNRLFRPVATRWNSQSRSVSTVYHHITDLIKTMEFLETSETIQNDNTIAQANGHLKTLQSNSFIFWLSFFQKIMALTDILSSQLQKVQIDIDKIVQSLYNFQKNIQTVKDEIEIISEEEEEDDDDEDNSGKAKRRKMDDSVKDRKRQAKQVCDVIINQSKERFKFTGHIACSALFSSQNFAEYDKKFPSALFASACQCYKFVLKDKFRSELETIFSTHEFRNVPGVAVLYEFLMANKLDDTFTETVKVAEAILAIPMSSSEADRCFSTLKRVRTFLRNTKFEDRLSALAMLSIEKKMIMDIPDFNQKVMDKFALLKERRLFFNFK